VAPPTLALAGAAVLLVWPASGEWPRQAGFVALPYLLFAAAAGLGLAFTQTRFVFVAACMAATVFQVDYAFFVEQNSSRGQAALLLGTILIPCAAAVFFRLNERGLFTSHGAIRALAITILLGFAFVLPLSAGFRDSVRSSAPPAFRPGAGWLGVPGLGLLALLGSAPFLLSRRKGESPLLGPLLLASVLLISIGLGFQSALWRETQQRTALLLFSTLGGGALVWAVIESAWRHINIDELTELPGRRALRHRLRCLGESYVIAVVDIDHFKHINDAYGHLVGDQVLRFIAAELSKTALGTAYRYGGEEFVIVFENRSYPDVMNNLDDLRQAIERKQFRIRGPNRPAAKPKRQAKTPPEPGESQPLMTVTVSIGAARPGPHFLGPQAVLEAADQALYRAKETGRNRVCHVT